MARRLTKELQQLTAKPLDFATASPVGDNIMHWRVIMMGPDDTPYAGGVFQLDLTFPPEYPFKPPVVKFITKIYHPNVKSDLGEICQDMLTEGWGPTLNVQYVLTAVRDLLKAPNAGTPLEPEIAKQFTDNKAAYDATAAEWTRKYASN